MNAEELTEDLVQQHDSFYTTNAVNPKALQQALENLPQLAASASGSSDSVTNSVSSASTSRKKSSLKKPDEASTRPVVYA